MAISLVDSGADSAGNANDCVINFSAQEDDVVVVMGGHAGSSNAGVSSSGYTEVIDNSKSGARLSVSWKRMGGSPDSSVTCHGSNSGADGSAYIVYVFRGVHPAVALDASSTDDSNNNDDPNSPAISVNTIGAAVISCFVKALDQNSGSFTQPTNYKNKVVENKSESNPITAGASWRAMTSTGTENPSSWNSTGNARWIAATIALRPAVDNYDVDAVGSFTGTATASFVDGTLSLLRSVNESVVTFRGGAIKPSPFNATGTATASFAGISFAPSGAFDISGTGQASFVGALEGAGDLSVPATWSVAFRGDYPIDSRSRFTGTGTAIFVGKGTRLKHVLPEIESRGSMTVTVRGV